ncbi:glycoside hydrolase family 3 C-terminal domain-containing protein [Streptomyces sp. NPDC005827]|uniref:glycoside hydrolase family 3 protein n=1 Tax=Streptomyces sp. NPDC005827 TaxID=3157070 RepID=UPI0033CF816C
MSSQPAPVTFEHLPDGLGIGVSEPRLSWTLPAGTGPQTAYEIETVRDGVTERTGRVDDSGQLLVPWPGRPLASRKQIDEAAYRVVKACIKAGLFDHPVPATPDGDVSTAAHEQLARKIVTDGTVLLKIQDGVSASTVCDMSGFGAGLCTNHAITERAARTGATVTYDNGADPAAAAAAAADADVAIVIGYSKMGEGSDRTNLDLDGNGDALISAVAAADHNTVAVLETGSAVLMPWQNDVKGILEAWYPGEQQGTASARLLWGDDNPSGRLPMTFPESLADLPTRTDEQYPGVFADGSTTRRAGDTGIRQVSYSEGLAVGHK